MSIVHNGRYVDCPISDSYRPINKCRVCPNYIGETGETIDCRSDVPDEPDTVESVRNNGT
jgi:hypothetical protein